ncbi:MAG: hypothetical protein KGL25_08490 [Gammaproteobacteria bacterium]|nr:hypothetical protein [Gammaproteobacteria bacterium]
MPEEAFRSFGGATEYVLLDNLGEGVIRPNLYEPELNSVYAAMLARYEPVADSCGGRGSEPQGHGRVGDPAYAIDGTGF